MLLYRSVGVYIARKVEIGYNNIIALIDTSITNT